MNIYKVITIICIIATTGCTSIKNPFYNGDHYKTDLEDFICYYNNNNKILFTNRNMTCSFLGDAIMVLRKDKSDFLMTFSSPRSSTGQVPVYLINNDNIKQLTKIFIAYIKWSRLDEQDRISTANSFNNSMASTNRISSYNDIDISYVYMNRAPSMVGIKEYEDRPLLMIMRHETFFGLQNSSAWLITPENALHFLLYINKATTLLDKK
ncbi:hypothetical protein [Aeromonas hydrophila]|uniref:hypothetical protein n=2 Tax=Aeromonas hydrophila TaxID=644 RepID=UPI002B461122|nr:hypothetical protein [Aeromonas hydrophila]